MDIYTFYLRYIDLNLKSYGNIGIDFEINRFLLIFMFIIIGASVAINYNRWVIITTIKRLVRHEAYDEETAKTLKELKLSSKGVRSSLKNNGQLTRTVRRVGELATSYEEYLKEVNTKGYKEEKIDYDTTRFHIREECVEDAKIISLKSDVTPLGTFLLCVLIFAVFMCLFFLMPEILSLVNTLIGML
ncbi:MAG: hypothetical protein J6Q85_05255 [Clostridia bacterium]|nr:hypothetical protein [Clostridia bacterium]